MPQDPIIPPTPSDEYYRVDEDQGDVFAADDPLALFRDWLALAKEKEINDPNAMALATVDGAGTPDVRMVLLKDLTEDGFSFFTNSTSAKGRQIRKTPQAALCFHWKSIRRQVRVRGTVQEVSPADADAYFATRARGAQIGAWASDQSSTMPDDDALTRAIAATEKQFEETTPTRPPHWTGYRLRPTAIEFWVNRPYRLHDRLLFEQEEGKGDNGYWRKSRLYP